MSVLIVGARGQLGQELLRYVPSATEVVALGSDQLDVTDTQAVQRTIEAVGPQIVINAAAYTAVDLAETHPGRAMAVNQYGARDVAQAAHSVGARVIHISTDYVFDGQRGIPYEPDSEPNPLSVYGATKLAGEQAVLDVTQGDALIVRTAWLYASHGANFLLTMVRKMMDGSTIRVIDDHVSTPTWAGSLARVLWQVSGHPELRGIHHWTDAGVASWYDFAIAIQEEGAALGVLPGTAPIIPIPSIAYPTPARRPSYSVLRTRVLRDALGISGTHWRLHVRCALKELVHA
jgi:dTDP-4-dehydrorhamnose reductase